MEELDDTVEEETSKIEPEDTDIEAPNAEESEIDVLEDNDISKIFTQSEVAQNQ